MSNSLITPTFGNTNRLVKPKSEYNLTITKNTTNVLDFNSVGSPIYFSLEPKFANANDTIVRMEVNNNNTSIYDEIICGAANNCNIMVNLNDKIISNNNNPNFNGSVYYGTGLIGSSISYQVGNCSISTLVTGSAISNGSLLSFFGLNGTGTVINKISRMNLINPYKHEFWFLGKSNLEGSGNLGVSLGIEKTNSKNEFREPSLSMQYWSGTKIGSFYCPYNVYVGSLLNDTWYKGEFNTYGGSSYNVAVYDSGTTPSLIHSVSGLSLSGTINHIMFYNSNSSPQGTDARYTYGYFDDITSAGSGIYTTNSLTYSYYSGNGTDFTNHYGNESNLKVVSGY